MKSTTLSKILILMFGIYMTIPADLYAQTAIDKLVAIAKDETKREKKRINAVNEISDENILHDIALNTDNFPVKESILSKLNDQKKITEIIQDGGPKYYDLGVKISQDEKLLEIIAKYCSSNHGLSSSGGEYLCSDEATQMVISKINNQDILIDLLKQHKFDFIGNKLKYSSHEFDSIIVSRFDNINLLADLSENTKDRQIQNAFKEKFQTKLKALSISEFADFINSRESDDIPKEIFDHIETPIELEELWTLNQQSDAEVYLRERVQTIMKNYDQNEMVEFAQKTKIFSFGLIALAKIKDDSLVVQVGEKAESKELVKFINAPKGKINGRVIIPNESSHEIEGLYLGFTYNNVRFEKKLGLGDYSIELPMGVWELTSYTLKYSSLSCNNIQIDLSSYSDNRYIEEENVDSPSEPRLGLNMQGRTADGYKIILGMLYINQKLAPDAMLNRDIIINCR